MIASAYIQVVAERAASTGNIRKLRIVNLTQGPPAHPEGGALVMKLQVNVDPDVFAIPVATVMVPGDPKELEVAVAPYPVGGAEEEDEGTAGEF